MRIVRLVVMGTNDRFGRFGATLRPQSVPVRCAVAPNAASRVGIAKAGPTGPAFMLRWGGVGYGVIRPSTTGPTGWFAVM